MIKTLKNLILSTIFLVSASPLFATHLAGGNISYICTGIPNTYLITLTIYRDCQGVNLGNTATVQIFSDCAGLTMPNLTVTRQEINEVSQICTLELPNTECGSGTLAGIEEHIYTAVVVLPGPCDAWHFTWEAGARNNAVTNLMNPGGQNFFLETTMNSVTNNCNNSPTFNSQPIPYVCANQATNYDFGILELDGDALLFEFVSARGVGGADIPYVAGYTSQLPIPGIIMNPTTGLLTFSQGVVGNFVITIKITETDICGNEVGSMMHDIQVVVENCTNIVPDLVQTPSVIQNFNNFGTNATVLNDNTINLCTGDKFCFDVQFDDANGADIVSLFSNVDDFLPGATFTQTSGNPAIGTVCWEFAQGYTGNAISIQASDDKCPVPGFADVVIKLDVPPALFPGGDSIVDLCGTEGTLDLFTYLQGFFQNNGQWYDPNNQTISNFQDAANMITGDYYYRVLPDTTGTLCGNPPNPCVLADTAFLFVTTGNLNATFINSALQNETCQGTDDGQASVGPITGNFGPFTVVWTSPYNGIHDTQIVAADSIVTQTNLYQDQLGDLPWTVTVTDQNDCEWSHQFFMYEGGLTITAVFGEPTCYGYDNGSLITNITGGVTDGGGTVIQVITNSILDTLNGADQTPAIYQSSLTDLPAGTYIVTASDLLGCTATQGFVLNNPGNFSEPMELTYTQENVRCFGDATGSIAITDVLNVGTGEPMEDLDFKWAPIPPGNDPNGQGRNYLNDLPAGEYTLVVTNSNGCNVVPNPTIINITEPLKLQANPIIKQHVFCRTLDIQSGNGQVKLETIPPLNPDGFGGTGTPSIAWTHLVDGSRAGFPEFTVKRPGHIELVLTDFNDCVFKDTIYMDSINPIADFTISSDEFYVADIYEGQEELSIKVELADNITQTFLQEGNPNSDEIYQWNLNSSNVNDEDRWFITYDSLTKPDTSYFGVNFDGPTTYQVCLITKNFNDCAATTCKDVLVHRIPNLILPNVFTPGTVPNQEFFFPLVGYSEFKATVYNRYGVKVYEFEELTDKWDGNHYKSGKACSDGVYTYEYRAITTNGTETDGTGNIHLIRHKP